jgi:hypothetical protein
MLNLYVLVHFQLGLLYPLVAIRLFYFLIINSFQLLNALRAFMFSGPPMVYDI